MNGRQRNDENWSKLSVQRKRAKSHLNRSSTSTDAKKRQKGRGLPAAASEMKKQLVGYSG